MKFFLIALQFLTILPVRIKSHIKPQDFGKSLIFFPLVGMVMGLFLVIILFLTSFLPNIVTAAIILVVLIILSGGIHLDGFADTCDGLYRFENKEKALEIMRDSHIGTMGVVGIVTLLLLKFTLLASIPKETLWKYLILTLAFARWSQVFACSLSNYARDEGKAKYFIEFARIREIFIATLFTVVVFFLVLALKGIILYLILILPVFLFIDYIKKKIGGMTGDTIGATSEIAEALVLLVGLILININL